MQGKRTGSLNENQQEEPLHGYKRGKLEKAWVRVLVNNFPNVEDEYLSLVMKISESKRRIQHNPIVNCSDLIFSEQAAWVMLTYHFILFILFLNLACGHE